MEPTIVDFKSKIGIVRAFWLRKELLNDVSEKSRFKEENYYFLTFPTLQS